MVGGYFGMSVGPFWIEWWTILDLCIHRVTSKRSLQLNPKYSFTTRKWEAIMDFTKFAEGLFWKAWGQDYFEWESLTVQTARRSVSLDMSAYLMYIALLYVYSICLLKRDAIFFRAILRNCRYVEGKISSISFVENKIGISTIWRFVPNSSWRLTDIYGHESDIHEG